ncbi:MAG: ATP-binding cassette domain-containing protein [Phycisphaerales bacterium]
MAGVDKDFEGTIRGGPELRHLPRAGTAAERDAHRARRAARGRAADAGPARRVRSRQRAASPSRSTRTRWISSSRDGVIEEKLDAVGAWELESQLEMAADALRCPPMDQPLPTCSGGEKRRVALCRLLLSKPDVLLLDEPTNHLDAESVAWLEQHLQRFPGTVIAVTHDRYFLDNVAGWILGSIAAGIPWKALHSSWLEQKKARGLAVEEKQESLRQRTLQRELDWIRQNPKGRRAKSKARISARTRSCSTRMDRGSSRGGDLPAAGPPGPGNLVIEAKDETWPRATATGSSSSTSTSRSRQARSSVSWVPTARARRRSSSSSPRPGT